jgi:hypothetical protein
VRIESLLPFTTEGWIVSVEIQTGAGLDETRLASRIMLPPNKGNVNIIVDFFLAIRDGQP